jgi:hypothetical protein
MNELFTSVFFQVVESNAGNLFHPIIQAGK